ncbi:MAG: ATP-binding protein [Vicinamibacteria bacterium]
MFQSFVLVMALGAQGSLGVPLLDLSGEWKFHAGDGSSFETPSFDDSKWGTITVPGAWSSQGFPAVDEAWYRRTVQLSLSSESATAAMGLRVGEVWTSYTVYANGRALVPLQPLAAGEYDRRAIYPLPSGQGPLTLAFHVVRRLPNVATEGGLTAPPLEIGLLTDLVRRDVLEDVPRLVMGAVFILIGITHILIYRKRQGLDEYIWFGLAAILMGAYTLLRTQYRFIVPASFATLKEAEYSCLFLLPVILLIFTRRFVERRISAPMKIYLLAQVAFALWVILTPGLQGNVESLPFWYVFVTPGVVIILLTLLQAYREGRSETASIFTGVALALASFCVDILIARRVLAWPAFISPFGFAWLMVSISRALADRFSNGYQNAQTLKVEFERRVEERTKELDRARAAAEAANQAKSSFLANISHEIRTPMNGVLGMTDILIASGLRADQEEQATVIQTSARALLGVINDVLDLSSVEAGKLVFQMAAFSPFEVLSQIERLVRPSVSPRVALTFHHPSPEERVIGDAARLRQVVLNLVSNAIRFTERGEVVVRCSLEDRAGTTTLTVAVQDTGIGISPEVITKLFTPFTQADESTTRKFGGTGLGLSIARMMVERMGGAITVESALGEGATFSFWIPVERAEPETAIAPPAPSVSPARDLPPARILVAEDNRVNQLIARTQIERLGHQVQMAHNGLEALSMLEADQPFDLIFLDCQMPELDGYQTAQRIRAHADPAIRELPIVALTAHAMESERRKSLDHGMDDHLAKPASIEEIAAMIDRWRVRRHR